MLLFNCYCNEICFFNDDIQGIVVVIVGILIVVSCVVGGQLSEKKIVFFGVGLVGCGIVEMIIFQIQCEGLSEEVVWQKVFMVDCFGLLIDKMLNLLFFQIKLVQKCENFSDWDIDSDVLLLLDVVCNVKLDILIGVLGQIGLFMEEIICEMYKYCLCLIVMLLFNLMLCVEVILQDIIVWIEGNVLVVMGSLFNLVVWKDKIYFIVQCNNVFIFLGIGLGVIVFGVLCIIDEMLMLVSEMLVQYLLLVLNGEGMVLLELKDIQKVFCVIVFVVGKMVQQ